MKSNHDMVVLNRHQLCEENVQRDSKIMIKRNYKDDETDCSTGSSENQERHVSFLRSAILKDEERRQIQDAKRFGCKAIFRYCKSAFST